MVNKPIFACKNGQFVFDVAVPNTPIGHTSALFERSENGYVNVSDACLVNATETPTAFNTLVIIGKEFGTVILMLNEPLELPGESEVKLPPGLLQVTIS